MHLVGVRKAVLTSMRPPSSEGGNPHLARVTPLQTSNFNEAALKRGRKQARTGRVVQSMTDFNEAALKRGRKPAGNPIGHFPCVLTSMRPPSSEGGNRRCRPSGPGSSTHFNEAALKRGRKPGCATSSPTSSRDFNEAALKRGRKRRAWPSRWRTGRHFNEAALKRGRKPVRHSVRDACGSLLQ